MFFVCFFNRTIITSLVQNKNTKNCTYNRNKRNSSKRVQDVRDSVTSVNVTRFSPRFPGPRNRHYIPYGDSVSLLCVHGTKNIRIPAVGFLRPPGHIALFVSVHFCTNNNATSFPSEGIWGARQFRPPGRPRPFARRNSRTVRADVLRTTATTRCHFVMGAKAANILDLLERFTF